MAADRITSLSIEGMRSIDALTLDLRGLTVLIGENGSGKSSIIEALEILRRAADRSFLSDFSLIHGGLFSLLRRGATSLALGASIEGGGPALRYRVRVGQEGRRPVIIEEALVDHTGTDVLEGAGGEFAAAKQELLLPRFANSDGPWRRMQAALDGIEVQVALETTAPWVARAHQRRSDARSAMQLRSAEKLDRLGANLANAFYTLKNEYDAATWSDVLLSVRLGLPRVADVTTRAEMGESAISLWVKMDGMADWVGAAELSEGQIAYLMLVALTHLPRPTRSLLAFDEPDLHLHPNLVARSLDLLKRIASEQPVLLTTHSDGLLDALDDPASEVRVLDLVGSPPVTRLSKLDAEALARWRDDYRGIGDLRGDGYLGEVVEAE